MRFCLRSYPVERRRNHISFENTKARLLRRGAGLLLIEADWTQAKMTSIIALKRIKLFEWRYRERLLSLQLAEKRCFILMDWKGCHLLWIRKSEPSFGSSSHCLS